jgi:hypothetical protein
MPAVQSGEQEGKCGCRTGRQEERKAGKNAAEMLGEEGGCGLILVGGGFGVYCLLPAGGVV